MSNDPLRLHSEISSKTKPELHLVAGEGTGPSRWYFRNDAGALVVLDDTHTLVSEYGASGAPIDPVELTVCNCTHERIEFRVTATGNAIVSQPDHKTLGYREQYTWKCSHSGGETCTCTADVECKCGSWNVTGKEIADAAVPDPTFKVRWQAHKA